MPAFQINDAEWGALADEPADVFKLYCAIRRFMDYRTGVSGVVRRLSEQMFREELYIAPTRGRHESGSPTRQKVRSLVDRLISIGVITPIGPLVFQLPNADWDGASKRSATDEHPDQQPHQQPQEESPEATESEGFSDLEDGSATASESAGTPISNLPPISVNPMVVLPREGHFPMPLDGWEPVQKSFKAIAFKNSVPVDALTPERLAAFCSYWHVRPQKEQSQAQWEYQLVDHLKHQLRQAQAGGYTHGSSKANTNPHRTGSQEPAGQGGGYQRQDRSAVGRVKAGIAERQRREQAEAATANAGEAMAQDGGDVRPPLDVEFWRIG
ncbi:DnaT-like ssDNA-binding domain-containing protein [Pseudomonas sp. PS01300]|uniref:DnaT-like ssDNA-binding domain-containing protein n=1 Tax=Pseudomonas sp. PS01300 TaxID=2991436 RepID=UPI00249B232F|nr:DnaT-like ssDNA-binding domain-containing protein [Pseudomonas sp. PS01300]